MPIVSNFGADGGFEVNEQEPPHGSEETRVRLRSRWASVHVAGPALAVIALIAVLGIVVIGVMLVDLSRQAIGDRAPQPLIDSEQPYP